MCIANCGCGLRPISFSLLFMNSRDVSSPFLQLFIGAGLLAGLYRVA